LAEKEKISANELTESGRKKVVTKKRTVVGEELWRKGPRFESSLKKGDSSGEQVRQRSGTRGEVRLSGRGKKRLMVMGKRIWGEEEIWKKPHVKVCYLEQQYAGEILTLKREKRRPITG